MGFGTYVLINRHAHSRLVIERLSGVQSLLSDCCHRSLLAVDQSAVFYSSPARSIHGNSFIETQPNKEFLWRLTSSCYL